MAQFSHEKFPWFVFSTSFSLLLFCFSTLLCSRSVLLLTPLRTSALIWLKEAVRFPPTIVVRYEQRCHNIGRKSWNDLGDSRLERALDKCKECEEWVRWQRQWRNGNTNERNFHWFQTLFTWRKWKQMKNIMNRRRFRYSARHTEKNARIKATKNI